MKLINPAKKSEFEVLNMHSRAVYSTIDELKHQKFGGKVSDTIQQVGYIEPGHGLRGKQRWLSSTDDLRAMYLMHKTREILLWCFGVAPHAGTKRSSENSSVGGAQKVPKISSNYNKHIDRIAEVGEIEDKLKEKHLVKFTDVQYRAWANLIKMKKYDSLDKAPDLPFWHGTSTRTATAVSPSKRINLRGQCVDQLLKWHQLLEKGAITKAQYDEFHSTIMDDVRKF